jgi:hypothetical protein
MKRLILTSLSILSIMVVNAQVRPLAPRNQKQFQTTEVQTNTQANNPNAPVFKFKEIAHDFGTLPEGPAAIYSYKFVNTGNEPLIISDVQKSCGCTTPDWTKEPILPGHSGTITTSFDTKGRVGSFSKTVSVISNAKQQNFQLSFTGTVVAAPPTTDQTQPMNEIKLDNQPH